MAARCRARFKAFALQHPVDHALNLAVKFKSPSEKNIFRLLMHHVRLLINLKLTLSFRYKNSCEKCKLFLCHSYLRIHNDLSFMVTPV